MEKTVVLRNILENRRSTFPKSYKSGNIDAEILKEILASAEFTPSHKRTRPWRFTIFENEEKKQLGAHLAALYKSTTPPQLFLEKKYLDISDKIEKAAAIITISVNFSNLVPEWEEIAATAMAVQNMYLTASAHDIGCYWSTPKMAAQLTDFLSLKDSQRCLGLFYLGLIEENSKQ